MTRTNPPISDVSAFLTKCICNLILRPFFANNPIIEKFPKKNIQYLDIFAREANLERFVRKYMQLEKVHHCRLCGCY